MTTMDSGVAADRGTVMLWLPVQPVTRQTRNGKSRNILLNTNDPLYHNPHARHAGQVYWESLTRSQLDHTFVIERAYIVVRFFRCSEQQADVSNLHPTAKAIVDGLVRKPDSRGVMQDGFLPDDNDKRIIGPDLRRGVDSSLRVGRKHFVQIRVEITPIGPLVERWWEPEMSLPLDLPWM